MHSEISICLFVLIASLAPAAYADGIQRNAAKGKELFMGNTWPTCHRVSKGDDDVIWSAETLNECPANPEASVSAAVL